MNASRALTISNLSTSGTLTVNVRKLAYPFGVFYSGGYLIQPGSSMNVSITFSPGQIGTVSQNLIITSNDPAHPAVSVQVVGIGGAL